MNLIKERLYTSEATIKKYAGFKMNKPPDTKEFQKLKVWKLLAQWLQTWKHGGSEQFPKQNINYLNCQSPKTSAWWLRMIRGKKNKDQMDLIFKEQMIPMWFKYFQARRESVASTHCRKQINFDSRVWCGKNMQDHSH